MFRSSAYGLYFVNTVWNQCRELLENLQETTCIREDDQHRIKKLWNNIGLYTGNTSTSRLKYCVVKERVICLCTNNSLYRDSFRNIRYLKILDISSDRYKGIFFFFQFSCFHTFKIMCERKLEVIPVLWLILSFHLKSRRKLKTSVGILIVKIWLQSHYHSINRFCSSSILVLAFTALKLFHFIKVCV